MSSSPGFDPGGVAVKNGRFFGFPYTAEDAEILVVSAPWDVTTSYRDGTSKGPAAVLEASGQLDFTSPYRKKAWRTRIGTAPTPAHWPDWNRDLRAKAKKVIESLEAGEPAPAALLAEINERGALFHAELEAQVARALGAGKKVVTLGGDHSVSFGPLRAHGKKFPRLSVLHIDAHADIRVAYEGFEHSHASIMHHVSRMPFVEALVQVGLRDFSPEELAEADENPRIHPFFDADIRRETARGASWQQQCRAMIEPLGREVYLSVDIDGLDPRYCPSTGTPVPGGLEYWELLFLLEEVERSGRRFVGADLVEVAPGETEWDANVGARLLFQICQFLRSEK